MASAAAESSIAEEVSEGTETGGRWSALLEGGIAVAVVGFVACVCVMVVRDLQPRVGGEFYFPLATGI
jgi:hypothetical protein